MFLRDTHLLQEEGSELYEGVAPAFCSILKVWSGMERQCALDNHLAGNADRRNFSATVCGNSSSSLRASQVCR
jgi:hypothetical protein